MTRRYSRSLTRAQRTLLELQRLTDINTGLRETLSAFRPVVEAVARGEYQEAAAVVNEARPYLGHLAPKFKMRYYTPEFKAEVVKLLNAAPHRAKALLMRKLGIASPVAYSWVRQVAAGRKFEASEGAPDVAVGPATAETREKLEAAKAAFSDVWRGGSRTLGKRSDGAATLSTQEAPLKQRWSRVVARKNGSPFQKV